MSQHRDMARLRRSISALTIGVVQSQRVRERELGPISGGDMGQQVQFPVNGRVGRTPVMEELDVQWPHPFMTRVSTARSNMAFENPTLAIGIELQSEDAVLLQAQVKDWIEDDSSFLVGAKVRIIAWCPSAPKLTTFSGIVHLSFFGYAVPSDDDSEG